MSRKLDNNLEEDIKKGYSFLTVPFSEIRKNLDYLTASLKVFPALNLGTLVAGIRILAPVAGFRPSRAALDALENVPNPVKVTELPDFTMLWIVSKAAFNTRSAEALVSPEALAMFATNSDLVTAIFPPKWFVINETRANPSMLNQKHQQKFILWT